MKTKNIEVCLHLITNDNKHIYKYFVDKKSETEYWTDVKKRLEDKIQLWLNCNGNRFKSYCYFETDPVQYGQSLFPDVGFKDVIIDVPVICEETING